MRRSSRRILRGNSQLTENLSDTSGPSSDTKNQTKTPTQLRKLGATKRSTRIIRKSASDSDADEFRASSSEPPAKKRKLPRPKKDGRGNVLYERLFNQGSRSATSSASCDLPDRVHSLNYHVPLLLHSQQSRVSLLTWFDGISSARSMPWRKTWIDPRTMQANPAELRMQLERRAYEVWISEIMLQQTRVAVVIDYWNRWMARWPTIQELAAAEPDDVLAAWRGLGYYSRATRIHDAAKLVCSDSDMAGLLPSDVDELVAKIPGVGRYTAGAISAIVFGHAAPMVDGNVLRVLSRQLGVLGDVKTDKSVIDLLWAAADALVKAVASDTEASALDTASTDAVSDRPGRWGQALMELGSTVCTPKPNCAVCPISSSCRAYEEGRQLAVKKGLAAKDLSPLKVTSAMTDIEDACNYCQPLEECAVDDRETEDGGISETNKMATSRSSKKQGGLRQSTLQSSFAGMQPEKQKLCTDEPLVGLNKVAFDVITNHARKFPVKVIKKAVRQEETLVCAIRRSDGRFLIRRRPEKGLLAGLWEFPSSTLPDDSARTPKIRKQLADNYVLGLLTIPSKEKPAKQILPRHVGELGSIPWLFSHLKLTMHVHLFELDSPASMNGEVGQSDTPRNRWSDTMDDESMGTGMRKCWTLVKEAQG